MATTPTRIKDFINRHTVPRPNTRDVMVVFETLILLGGQRTVEVSQVGHGSTRALDPEVICKYCRSERLQAVVKNSLKIETVCWRVAVAPTWLRLNSADRLIPTQSTRPARRHLH